jgi:hypothetical protein
MIQALQKNRFFKFVSSVRLAVPLMLIIASVVAAGTLYESAYNSEVARILVYQTWWFHGLILLLWLNIFAATLSRFPFKEHHTGFVVTHMGMLTLLVGAMMTAIWGLDGQLRVQEGQSSNAVYLNNLVLKIKTPDSLKTYPVERKLESLTGEQLDLSRVRHSAFDRRFGPEYSCHHVFDEKPILQRNRISAQFQKSKDPDGARSSQINSRRFTYRPD